VTLLTHDRTAPSIRGSIRILLPVLALLPVACGPPSPRAADGGSTLGPAAAPPVAAPLTPAEIVWRSRPRAWDRLLIGLTHLPPRPTITAKPLGRGKLFELPSGRLLASLRANAPVMLSSGPGGTVRFVTTGASGKAPVVRLVADRGDLRLEGRAHTGALLCWRSGDRLASALDTSIEAYLRGVVPGEVPSSWPLEAQKALAVAARTYAQASRGKHAAEGFDLCDGTHCQMYLGHVPGAARSERAVRETRGLVALFDGRPIRAFYSADCGGRTANNEDVPFPDNPPEPMPYLRSVPDTPSPGGPHYCARSPYQHWARLLTSQQIETALNADPKTAIGTLRAVQVVAADGSGRAKMMRMDGTVELAPTAPGPGGGEAVHGTEMAHPAATEPAPSLASAAQASPSTDAPQPTITRQPVSRTMAGYAFRRAVGPRRLKSTRFTVTQVSPTLFRVSGSGYGHGVGLCQIGARGMALPPYRCTFRQILAHYYQGVTVATFRPQGGPP
jgi:stage II sporulation protein D